MRAALRKLFLHDTLLKAVSLVLAVVLFVVVRGDKDAATSAFVKVIYKLPTDRVLVSDPTGELKIAIRGPWTRVTRFDERQVEAVVIDLQNTPAGEFRFTEEQIRLPVGLRLSSIAPASVPLRFEPRVEREMPIQPIVEGEPAPGYRVGQKFAHPSKVTVSGAKSVVDGLQRVVTTPLRIADARSKVEGQVRLEPLPPHAWFTGSDSTNVEAEVIRDVAERIVKSVPVKVNGLTRLDGGIKPEKADVVLRGPPEALAAVGEESLSLVVDAQGEDGRPPNTYTKTISVVGLPTGLAAEVRPKEGTLVTRRRRD